MNKDELTLAFFEDHGACEEALTWMQVGLAAGMTFDDLWVKCDRPDWLYWVLMRVVPSLWCDPVVDAYFDAPANDAAECSAIRTFYPTLQSVFDALEAREVKQ